MGETLIRILGIVQAVLCVLVFIMWSIFKMPLDVKEAKRILRQRKEYTSKFKVVNMLMFSFDFMEHMCLRTNFLYLSLTITFVFLGIFNSFIFFSFILIDFIDRSPILRNVIRSITTNYRQLLMTAFLGVLVLYIYSVIGYYTVIKESLTYMDQDNLNLCQSMLHCYLSYLDLGLSCLLYTSPSPRDQA
eukprot:TRINITY_DN31476_c0_g1_i1.p2 TRINITY_DN31476_c0_g1~~TRINITY_DN31476_c0_g1_i1.p2  ORF type:complete len:189 (-),score=53.68 TRINITY_DN31476_c0_g1_i1:33-599(-)